MPSLAWPKSMRNISVSFDRLPLRLDLDSGDGQKTKSLVSIMTVSSTCVGGFGQDPAAARCPGDVATRVCGGGSTPFTAAGAIPAFRAGRSVAPGPAVRTSESESIAMSIPRRQRRRTWGRNHRRRSDRVTRPAGPGSRDGPDGHGWSQGATDIGQGSNTVITQICADALGLPLVQFELI